ncbi:MAG: citrate/2-methylcitrate synthase [bacterium]
MHRIFSVVPPPPKFNPVREAIERANELSEKQIATTLGYFATMPASTAIIANPVLHQTPVDCNGTTITLEIRSFTIRGIVQEAEIVEGKAGPLDVIFAGLFGQRPDALDESAKQELAALIDEKFFGRFASEAQPTAAEESVIEQVARFVKEFPGLGPEIAMQQLAVRKKALLSQHGAKKYGVNDERDPLSLLTEMITVHLENVAAGTVSAYMNHILRKNPQTSAKDLATVTRKFIEEEKAHGRSAFQVSYSLILGHHANESECLSMERMGTIQIHHGSAGSNMVARYMATLHALSVSDLFTACQMAMDGTRHFGAIHDMSNFVQELEPFNIERRADRIREKMLSGGLPTFGHPEISAAGRGNHVQQDPRPAIYIDPVFRAIDAGQLTISPVQHQRLSIARQIYLTAFVNGVLKPEREDEPPLRLTPNTDFGAWCVQEALGIEEIDRTLLTYIFRGFGWMMDAREQVQQKMIRPVVPPDPAIVPKSSDDPTIPNLVAKVHQRLIKDDPFKPTQA